MNNNDDLTTVLVELLARSDTLFAPIRNWTAPFPAGQYQALQEYLRDGTRHGGGKANERQRAADLRKRLAESGLVTVKRGRSAIAAGLILTERGELFARSACGHSRLTDSRKWLLKLHELRSSPNGWADGALCWVSEQELAGVEYGDTCKPGKAGEKARQKLTDLQWDLVPLIRRGWACQTSDAAGRTWYAIAKDIGDPNALPIPEVPKDAPEAREEWTDLFWEERAATVERLTDNAPPDPQEIGPIPASASPPLRRFTKTPAAVLDG